jgi:hypothetical protein
MQCCTKRNTNNKGFTGILKSHPKNDAGGGIEARYGTIVFSAALSGTARRGLRADETFDVADSSGQDQRRRRADRISHRWRNRRNVMDVSLKPARVSRLRG